MATQADIDTLLAAIASGTARVRFSDGREVEYRSVGEIRDALALLRAELRTVPMMRTTRLSVSRG